MASLNKYISAASPPSLFLSSGLQIKLKSPTISHYVSSGIWMFLNHSRKALLPDDVQGAYIVVRIQELLFRADLISTEIAKSF